MEGLVGGFVECLWLKNCRSVVKNTFSIINMVFESTKYL